MTFSRCPRHIHFVCRSRNLRFNKFENLAKSMFDELTTKTFFCSKFPLVKMARRASNATHVTSSELCIRSLTSVSPELNQVKTRQPTSKLMLSVCPLQVLSSISSRCRSKSERKQYTLFHVSCASLKSCEYKKFARLKCIRLKCRSTKMYTT